MGATSYEKVRGGKFSFKGGGDLSVKSEKKRKKEKKKAKELAAAMEAARKEGVVVGQGIGGDPGGDAGANQEEGGGSGHHRAPRKIHTGKHPWWSRKPLVAFEDGREC